MVVVGHLPSGRVLNLHLFDQADRFEPSDLANHCPRRPRGFLRNRFNRRPAFPGLVVSTVGEHEQDDLRRRVRDRLAEMPMSSPGRSWGRPFPLQRGRDLLLQRVAVSRGVPPEAIQYVDRQPDGDGVGARRELQVIAVLVRDALHLRHRPAQLMGDLGRRPCGRPFRARCAAPPA